MRRSRMAAKAVAILLLLAATRILAGTFDNPKNLQVLPEDISAEELGQTMRGFTAATGTRCSACHVGEIEADLSSYDFALDDKESKAKARKMIALVQDINASLARAFPQAQQLVTVTCATCHRGQSKPEMIENVLAASLRDDGLDASVNKYRELRDRYYGGFTFDFSERMLMRFTEDLAAANEADAALRFLNVNLEYFPDSSRSYVLRAELMLERGDLASARRDYETALQKEPNSWWIKEQLDKLN